MKLTLHQDTDSFIIELEGDFSFKDARLFQRLLSMLDEDGSYKTIHVDVDHLRHIDSTGLSLLMNVFDMAKRHHKTILFEKPHGQVFDRLSEAATYNAIKIAA